MQKAHATIVRLGGIPKSNTYTKLFLALFGQYPWKYLPSIPAEIILLPNWLHFNIYEMSSWSGEWWCRFRLSFISSRRGICPPDKQLHELFRMAPSTRTWGWPSTRSFSRGRIFSWAGIAP